MTGSTNATRSGQESAGQLGRYRLLEKVGQGGMASVFLAVAPGLEDRPLACKVMLPHLAELAEARDMFIAEARMLAQLKHPGVVQLIDLGEDAGTPFLVTEYLLGETLDNFIERRRPIEVLGAAGVLVQIADALAFVHAARGIDGAALSIVHRDLSPHNVHVGFDGVVKLLDFGIADFTARQRLTRTGEVRGKLGYLAPEQVTRAVPVEQAADIWAFGVVARELLTGQPLFTSTDDASTLWNVTSRAIVPTREARDDVDDSVARLLDACLDRDPSKRPRASDVAQALSGSLRASAVETVRSLIAERTEAAETARAWLHGRLRSGATTQPRIAASARATEPRWRTGPAIAVAVAGAAVVAAASALAWVATARETTRAPAASASSENPTRAAAVADGGGLRPDAQQTPDAKPSTPASRKTNRRPTRSVPPTGLMVNPY